MTVAPDMLSQFGGAPVGSSQSFEGWWGATTWFVDYDSGTPGNLGDSMTAPTQYLDTAISRASGGDTIYVRPRSFDSTATYPEDPRQIIPTSTTANFTIGTTLGDLSVIGATKGRGHAQAHQCWIGGAVTGAVFHVHAPGVVLENFRAQPYDSSSPIIYAANNATYDAGNLTIQNWDFHDANTNGALQMESIWQASYVGNRFVNCDIGIYTTSTYSQAQIVQMWNNTFTAESGDVASDVYALGGLKRFLSYNNYHTSALPDLSGQKKYYAFTQASTGAIMNCFFGVSSTDVDDNLLLNGILQGGNFTASGQLTAT